MTPPKRITFNPVLSEEGVPIIAIKQFLGREMLKPLQFSGMLDMLSLAKQAIRGYDQEKFTKKLSAFYSGKSEECGLHLFLNIVFEVCNQLTILSSKAGYVPKMVLCIKTSDPKRVTGYLDSEALHLYLKVMEAVEALSLHATETSSPRGLLLKYILEIDKNFTPLLAKFAAVRPSSQKIDRSLS